MTLIASGGVTWNGEKGSQMCDRRKGSGAVKGQFFTAEYGCEDEQVPNHDKGKKEQPPAGRTPRRSHVRTAEPTNLQFLGFHTFLSDTNIYLLHLLRT